MPIGIAIRKVKISVLPEISAVSAIRSPTTSATARLSRNEKPILPRSRLRNQRQYWMWIGLSRPHCSRIASIIAWSAASPVSAMRRTIEDTMSPGGNWMMMNDTSVSSHSSTIMYRKRLKRYCAIR